MEFRNDKKIESTIKYVYYFISGVLCVFLILLTGRILDDLGGSVSYPSAEQFENKTFLDSIARVQNGLNAQAERYETKETQLRKAADLAEKNYQDAKASFDNWLEARKVLGEPSKDREVIAKTEALETYYAIRRDWNEAAAKIRDTIDVFRTEVAALDQLVNTERERANKVFGKAYQSYELKVFLIRLLFILPVLLLGIYFYIRRRNHQYWPLFLGFSWFALYAFFVGLVPYLPSYGGYVRYTVGVLLSAVGGYYAIKKIREYLEQRKSELQKPTEERVKQVESDTAFKAYEQHICPSCGKDFIFKNWAFTKQNPNDAGVMVSNFCRQCGFELYKNCENCGEKRFAHLPFCSNCGSRGKAKTAS
jgi:hypothetical protein